MDDIKAKEIINDVVSSYDKLSEEEKKDIDDQFVCNHMDSEDMSSFI